MAAGTGKCTFGNRAPIDIHMLNEIISREVKHFRNYKNYRPNFKAVPIASKFYAAHDIMKYTENENKKIEEYRKEVGQARALGPHSKNPLPVTTSHEYGWYSKPLVAMDRSDRRFYHPTRESIHTKIEVIIRMSNPTQKK
ncbi:PREDICTED: protein FAM183A-like [Papilio xuthus]|uniref:Protein FAM183A-like n=1 Tax=Papilio xuthus TaxID=66420 RepID=A0AAJ7EIE0_PAPXU|nr:PREDICTED: protein FAM183A-like [Papilio xuthus]